MDSPAPVAHLAPSALSPVEIDRPRRAVIVGGRSIALGARAFDLLAVLASQPGRVFADAELIAAVWPNRVVEVNNLRVQVAALRKQLGTRAIVNVAGRGYTLAPPAVGARAALHSSRLPRLLEPLLGRERDLTDLLALLRTHRLVTVFGAGGIGKTRLAQAAALQLEASHADGACWVDLAPLASESQIATAIAQEVGVQAGALDGDEAARNLGRALAGRDALLVLDNAEHLAPALAPLLYALLQNVPTLHLLVTSQQLLHVPGEQVYRLDPLPVPAHGATPAEARACAALQLLERCAQGADHRFAFSDAGLHDACELCRRLDGIALAIEMAGARLPLLGAAALNEHLGERLRLLGDEAGAAPPRQRTLRAALDWSHALLSDEEQLVLRRLSVFAAPFRLDSAQVVAADAALDAPAALRAIAGLADKSLLQVQAPHGSTEPQRYRLLESTRLYAAQALLRGGETAAAEARHARAMAALADRAQASYWCTPDTAWLDQWRADHDDLQLGFDRAAAAGDAESAALIGEALHGIANLIGIYSAVTARLPAALALLPQAAPLARARLWNRFGAGTVPGLTRVEAARRRVAAWREVGEPKALARALAMLASESQKAGDADAADAALAETRLLDDPAWPPRQRAMCVPLGGFFIAAQRGDVAALRASMRASLALAEAGGARRMVAQARSNLAQAEMLDGNAREAVALLHEAVAEFRALDCSLDVGFNLGNLCAALVAAGDAPAARNAAEQALLLLHDTEPLRFLFEPLAWLAWRLARPADAARMLGAADALRQRHAMSRQQLDERMVGEVRAGLAAALASAERAVLLAEGARFDADALREAALAWLHAAR